MPHISDVIIGFDIGATKIRCVAFDGNHAPCGYDQTSPTPKDYEQFMALIKQHVHGAEKDRQATFVGFAIPGFTDVDGNLVASNMTAVNGRPVHEDLKKLLDPRCTKWENDANCFAISELEAQKPHFPQLGIRLSNDTVVVGLILGSGVGSGIVDGTGKILRGANGLAGECGHFPLPSNVLYLMDDCNITLPRQCGCSLWNCTDIFCSGRGFELLYASYFQRPSPSSQEVLVSCTAGDPDAVKFVDLFLTLLAHVLATMIAVIDPDVIIFGGGLGAFIPEAQLKQLAEKIDPLVLGKPPILRQPLEGPSSGVRGAAFQNQ